MAFTLRGTQSSLWQPQGARRPRVSAPRLATNLCLVSGRLPSVRCSAQGGDASAQGVRLKSTPSQSWMHRDSSFADTYAGWSLVESDATDDFSRGLLKIGMGIALGVGFALASYSIYSRKGFSGTKDGLAFVPVVFQRQQGLSISFADSAGPEETSTTTPKLNVDTQGPVEASESITEEVTDLHQPNNSEDPTLAGSSENGNAQQSERGSITVNDAGIEQKGNTIESNGSINSNIVKEIQVIEPVANNESDVPVNHTSSLTVSEIFPIDDAEQVNSEFPTSVEAKDTREATGSSEVVIATSLDLDCMARAAEKLLEEIEQDIFFSSPTFTPVHVPSGTIDLMISSVPLSPDSLNESMVNVNASEHVDKVVRSSMFEVSRPALGSEVWKSPFGIPAPSAHSAASKVKLGRVLVPAVVDQLQEQALAAMHGLKVIEAHTEAGNICTRREYARWLIAASHTLARSSAHKVFPAMYIENVSELAFDDVLPEDPDFPFIQGLAEAGLISSRLSDLNEENIENRVLFLPDSPLSRQDLVSWKVALEQHNIPKIDNESLQTVSGFIDLEKIHKDALPALAVDVSAGERSITAMAFGYTRRFQPDKPVTIAQAAVALTSGEAGEHVAEELARLEAETLAEAAVSTEIAMEARAKKEANAAYIEELEEERKCTAAAQSLVGALRLELEAFKTEREEEKFAILKDRAAIESEKEFVSHIRIDIERLSQELSNEKVKVAFDREKLEKLVAEAEREKLSITTVRSELEVEKKALTLARRWAEDEAKQARAHAKILEEARKRWENQGIEVHVDQELDDNNIPSTIWTYDHEKVLSESSLQKSHNLNIAATAEEIKRKCKEILDKLLEVSGKKFIESRQETHEALQEIWKKALEIQQATYSIATEKSHELNEKTNELQKAAISAVAGLSAQVVEGTKKLADGCKGGAEKLVERFKT
ncbi:hypothetical protein O6H91_09G052800 [Diphasiastrum complanatum]|uniref:Uncharacterized protein n=3 Tax=Diphasiastrum complanatum TaxID=34168 RepID=A0ACC2CP33_DIPCM|nr:hypothetical protein O6H91_09G052800 [Diphasiastrum complanatum]KAJ7543796.1 hypothetical protein O6H91_09G052800 [Diphasiastrum complanatum]KAJ7543797.1 hypothetical protein O6H91_09G052800 [Diphasiastrum complanatum]